MYLSWRLDYLPWPWWPPPQPWPPSRRPAVPGSLSSALPALPGCNPPCWWPHHRCSGRPPRRPVWPGLGQEGEGAGSSSWSRGGTLLSTVYKLARTKQNMHQPTPVAILCVVLICKSLDSDPCPIATSALEIIMVIICMINDWITVKPCVLAI